MINKLRLEESMTKGCALEESLSSFCMEHLQDFVVAKGRMWDEKENDNMNDEMLEGSGHAQIMSANLWDMAHEFVLQNVELMSTWCM